MPVIPWLPLGLVGAHHRDRRAYGLVREPRSDTEACDFLRLVYCSISPTDRDAQKPYVLIA